MILTCPACATRYFVADDKVGAEGRPVKCANCGNRWVAMPEAEPALAEAPASVAAPARAPAERPRPAPAAIAAEPEPQVTPEPEPAPEEVNPAKAFREKVADDKKMKEAATVGVVWAAMLAILALIVGLAIIFRVEVVRIMPRVAGAYATVGLPVNHVGLVIEQLKAEPSLKDGHAALTVSGVLRNIEAGEVVAPPLKLSLLNPAGKRVAGKIAAAQDPKIPAGESRHFAIAILDPPSTARDLEIGFELGAGGAKAVREAAAGPADQPKKLELRGAAEAPAPPPAPDATPAEAAPPPPPAVHH